MKIRRYYDGSIYAVEIRLPSFSFRHRFIDFRQWYYVWIDNEKMNWWAMEYEMDDIRNRYDKVEFKKIPKYKTIIK